MVFVTTLASELNKLAEKSDETKTYLDNNKNWKAFTEGDLEKIKRNEEFKIGDSAIYQATIKAKALY